MSEPRSEGRLRIGGNRGERLRIVVSPEHKPESAADFDKLYNVPPEKYEALLRAQNNSSYRLPDTRVSHNQRCFYRTVRTERGTTEQFYLTVVDKVPAAQTDLLSLAHLSAVLCIAPVRVDTGKGSLSSKYDLPVLLVHGGRDGAHRHVVEVGTPYSIESKNLYGYVNTLLEEHDLPPIAVFISCDERIGRVGSRWEQEHGVPLIAFAGDINAIGTSGLAMAAHQLGIDKSLEIDVPLMEQRGARLHPFKSSGGDPLKQAMIDGLFKKDLLYKMREKITNVLKPR